MELRVEALEREGMPWLCFRVKDSGIGLSKEQQERIFQEFTQGDESTSRRYGGTGLGLTLSRRLSELMGGSVSVESQPGQGSTFTLEIPAPPVEAGATPRTDLVEPRQEPHGGDDV